MEQELHSTETERARWLAKLGTKERELKEAVEGRRKAEEALKNLQSQIAAQHQENTALQAAEARAEQAEHDVDELQQKVRRLTKLASASESLDEARAEQNRLTTELEQLRLQYQKRTQKAEEERDHERQVAAQLREELAELRQALSQSRKRVSELEERAPDAASSTREGVAILLDQANLAATASIEHKSKVNYRDLLPRLAKGRKVRRAVAFVVDNQSDGFAAFAEALRRNGWEVRIRKPQKFRNGQQKADWDMGMAMEAVGLKDLVESVVLATGDSDFAPLIRRLQQWKLRVEVAAFQGSLGHSLAQSADAIEILGPEALE